MGTLCIILEKKNVLLRQILLTEYENLYFDLSYGFSDEVIVKDFYYYHTSENRRSAFTVPPVTVLYEHFCNIDNFKQSLKLKV